MRRLWMIMPALLALLVTGPVLAAKFGGGKSFGYQKPIQYRALSRDEGRTPAKPARQVGERQSPDKASAPSGRSGMMGGMLGGLLAGGLLAALFFGGAFDALAPADWLLILLIVGGLAFWWLRRRPAGQPAVALPAGETASRAAEDMPATVGPETALRVQTPESMPPAFGGSGAADLPDPPVWFDVERARRNAEQLFMRVQQAWDAGDADMLADMCDPQCFSAIRDQIRPGQHHTEVEFVHAEIIDWDYVDERFVVSVRFNGMVRENGGESHGFTEVWHLARPIAGIGPWKIVGVQQL